MHRDSVAKLSLIKRAVDGVQLSLQHETEMKNHHAMFTELCSFFG